MSKHLKTAIFYVIYSCSSPELGILNKNEVSPKLGTLNKHEVRPKLGTLNKHELFNASMQTDNIDLCYNIAKLIYQITCRRNDCLCIVKKPNWALHRWYIYLFMTLVSLLCSMQVCLLMQWSWNAFFYHFID